MSDADARKWRAWVLMPRHRRMKPEEWQPYNEAEAHGVDTYLHRDAARAWAGLVMWCKLDWPPTPVSKTVEGVRFMIKVYDECRAWQALRDFLDGTAEQWMAIREFAQEVLDVANELDFETVRSEFIRRLAKDVPGLEWNETRDG